MTELESDETILASIGVDEDRGEGAVMPPLYLSSSYSLEGFQKKRGYDYGRTANPTRDVLARALAALERGAGAVVTSSGMAAVDLVLCLLDAGALIVAPHDCYGGTWRLFEARARKKQIEVVYVDQSDAEALNAALARKPALVWIETPSNPLMRVVDVEAIARAAKAVGARVAADNTFLSPLLLKPIALGADFVVHSTTKYLNGHSDVVGGAVVAKDAADVEQLKWWANCCGLTGAPFDSWLTLRGLRTLSVRLERQQKTAAKVAAALLANSAFRAVHYPGLESHSGHAIAKRQQKGFGAMLSIDLAGEARIVPVFLDKLQRFTLAQSLGGVESLVSHPATMTHASMTPEARARAGITDTLLRLSIGLEHEDDLIADLEQATR
ncbi:cystathionine gamma-synthase [Vitreimonas sp.]|jgi:cystathionine gamma-synthase|uniref:cystathionine gamma-synthase n=1 Tax=Vitreimonas sp. TaxID=3069702 RepID=UPI002ED96245